jgi:hypothetical protein
VLFVFALLARCVPQDFDNPFVTAAALPTTGMAMLVLWVVSLWLLPRLMLRLQSRTGRVQPSGFTLFTRMMCALDIFSALVAVVAAVGTLWIWLQVPGFVAWCAPGADSTLAAQVQRAHVASIIGLIIFTLSLFITAGGGLAVGIAAAVTAVRRGDV